MKNILIFLASLSFVFQIQSCKKDPSTDITQRLWDCNASQHFDSTKLATSMLGSWQWTESFSESIIKADKNIKVVFTSSGTFTVTEDASVKTQGKWGLKIVDSGILGLTMDNSSEFLYGRILLCGDKILFNDSYRDGGDNLFTRVK